MINPTAGGGFESGATFAANGWTAINAVTNQWAVGTGSFIGTKGAYIGTATTFAGTASGTVGISHLYSNATYVIPATATSATLSFRLKQPTVDAGWDSLVVATTPSTTPLPVVNTLLSAAYTQQFHNSSTPYTAYTPIIVDVSSLINTNSRVVFTYANDGANPLGIPAIDSVSFTYCTLPLISGLTGGVCVGATATLSDATTGGTWTSASPLIASINATSGLVTGNLAGTTVVTYTTSTCKVKGIVTVNPLPTVYNVTGGGPVCSGVSANVGLSNSEGSGITYNLSDGTSTVFTLSGTSSALNFGAYTAVGTYTVSATNTITGCSSNMAGSAALTVAVPVTLSVSIAPASAGLICSGTMATLTASPVNGGTSPTYDWTVNGTDMGPGTASYTYTAAVGDVVSVVLTPYNICTAPSTATASYTVAVTPSLVPAVVVASAPLMSACAGKPVTFSSIATAGGSTPAYRWMRNGINVATGPTYSCIPANGDVVVCTLFSSYACRLADSVFSAAFPVTTITGITAPVVNIAATPGNVISAGQSDTLRAMATGAGVATASYQWYVNTIPVGGATSASYISSTFANMDIVTCKVTNSDACANSTLASKNIYVNNLSVGNYGVENSSISIFPNPNKGSFTLKGALSTTADMEVAVAVTNMLGQLVYSNKVMAHNGRLDMQIALPELAAGMYTVSINSAAQNTTLQFAISK